MAIRYSPKMKSQVVLELFPERHIARVCEQSVRGASKCGRRPLTRASAFGAGAGDLRPR